MLYRCPVANDVSGATDFGDRQAQKLAEPIAYLPLSSLASPNPTLPSPEVSLSIPPTLTQNVKLEPVTDVA